MNNLLVQLLRHKKEEDFFTEAFAHLLEHLMAFDYSISCQILAKLSQGQFNLDRYKSLDVKIVTQNHVKEGITDIEIIVPDFIVIIENKIEANLGYRQIERYKEHLQRYKVNGLLILLSKYPIHLENKDGIVFARWFEIHRYLCEINQEQLSEVSRFLVNQFMEFLSQKGLSIIGIVSSDLTKSINFLAKQHDLVFHKQIKSLEILKNIPDQNILYDFWTLAIKAIKYVRPKTKIKLGSGKSGHTGSAWLALNFDNRDIFCTVYFDKPNELVFETDFRIIDWERMMSIGTWEFFSDNHKCKRTLNLKDMGLFSCSDSEQLKMLEEYFRSCYIDLGEHL